MDCETVRELYISALVGSGLLSEEVDRHVASCVACREEIQSLAATWSSLGTLRLVEPSPRVTGRLRRRLRVEAAKETLLSAEHWQPAALVGVVAFSFSVLLSLVVPYDGLVAACREVVMGILPTSGAYVLAGALYGLLPLAVCSALQARFAGGQSALGAIESVVVFAVTLLPYVLVRCAEFPLALLVGFVGGITAGAVAGSATGVWLRRRQGRMGAATN